MRCKNLFCEHKLSQIKSKLWFVVILKSENTKHFWIFFCESNKNTTRDLRVSAIEKWPLLYYKKIWLYLSISTAVKPSEIKRQKNNTKNSKICVQQPNLFYFENPNNSNGLLLKFSIQYVSNKQISWALRHKNNKDSFSQILLLLFHVSASCQFFFISARAYKNLISFYKKYNKSATIYQNPKILIKLIAIDFICLKS